VGGINRQAQRRRPSRLAYRHPDEARQPLAAIPHRRADALALRQGRNSL